MPTTWMEKVGVNVKIARFQGSWVKYIYFWRMGSAFILNIDSYSQIEFRG